LEKMMRRIEVGAGRKEDLELLLDVGDSISPGPFPHTPRPELGEGAVPFPYSQTTICPLGPSAVSPVDSSMWRFRDEYLRHIEEGGCPYG
jgi:NADH-quinone oxidoreductase subunit F